LLEYWTEIAGIDTGVAAQFIALMSQADLVLGLPLPDELEPGPVFLP
jgi:hypothetical protein